MAAEDDTNLQFGRVLLSNALSRIEAFKFKLADALDEAQDVRFIASLRADVARNQINQTVARIHNQHELLEELRVERLLLDAALDSAEG